MGTTVIGDYDPDSEPLIYQGAFAGLRMNTTDSGYFPEYGVNMGIRSDVVSSLIRNGGESTFGILDAAKRPTERGARKSASSIPKVLSPPLRMRLETTSDLIPILTPYSGK